MAREPLPRPLPQHRRHAVAPPSRTRRSGGRRARILVGLGTVAGLVAAGTTVGAVVGSGDAAQAKSETFTATDDAYVSAARPDFNTGTSPKLVASEKAGDRKLTYLRFVVPAGTEVASARLTLRRTNHHLPPVVQVHRTDPAGWSETTLTMRSAPKLGELLAAVDTPRTGRDLSLDVSSVVRGPGSYAFAVSSPATDDVAAFVAKEAGAGGPVLVTSPTPGVPPPGRPAPPVPTIPPIAPPAPTATATPTATPTGTPTTTPPAPAPPGRPGCTVSKILAPSCGAWFGAAPHALTSEPRLSAMRGYESTIGRQVDVMHVYHTNDQLFPTADELKMAREPGHRRLLFVNWKPSTSRSWAQVAAGDPAVDQQIDKLAAHVGATFPERFFLSIFHEPENDINAAAGSGYTAKDYRAMHRYVVQRLRAKGMDNAVFVMVYMGAPKWGAQSWFKDLYPGDDVVDWLGYDPYASAQPGAHGGGVDEMVNRRAPSLYGSWPGFYNWAEQTVPGKPIVMAEWGVAEWAGAPNRKAEFHRSVAGDIAKYPRIKAMLHFDARNAHVGDTRADSTATSLAGFRAMVQDPYFRQTVPAS